MDLRHAMNALRKIRDQGGRADLKSAGLMKATAAVGKSKWFVVINEVYYARALDVSIETRSEFGGALGVNANSATLAALASKDSAVAQAKSRRPLHRCFPSCATAPTVLQPSLRSRAPSSGIPQSFTVNG